MIYIFTDVNQGGTFRFFTDLKTIHECVILRKSQELTNIRFQPKDILLYQKINEPMADSVVLKIMSSGSPPRLIIVAHDYFFLCNSGTGICTHTPSFSNMAESKKTVFQKAEMIIFPSHYLKNYYQQFFSLPTFQVIPHIDTVCFQPLRIPEIKEKKIKLGIITPLSLFKGKYHFIYLFKHVHFLSGFRLEYNLFGTSFPYLPSVVKSHPPYKEEEIYLKIGQIHGMLFLNHFPEMYSYALTKGINSGLPILYSDMGAIKERLDAYNDPRYFATDPSDKNRFLQDMENFVSFIISHQGIGGEIQNSFQRIIPDFYKTLND